MIAVIVVWSDFLSGVAFSLLKLIGLLCNNDATEPSSSPISSRTTPTATSLRPSLGSDNSSRSIGLVLNPKRTKKTNWKKHLGGLG